MASNRDHLSLKKKRNEEIKSLLGPCMISFAIPLFIPGLTITLVAFSDETGFSKYGTLHVVGILILSAACVLLVVGCVIKCTCKSKVFPMMQVASHKVTTHEKPKQMIGVTLTRDRLPPLNHGPLPGGSSIPRDHVSRVPARSLPTTDSGSDSGDMTVSASEDDQDSPHLEPTNFDGLPANNFMLEPSNNNIDKTKSGRKETAILIENTDSSKSYGVTNTTSALQVQNAAFLMEDERQSTKANLACPSYTDLRHNGREHRTSDARDTPSEQGRQVSPEMETRLRKPASGWLSRQSDDRLMVASKISSETLSHSESSEVTDDRDADDDDDDDATLTEASRNCSTVPEIADLDRDDTVEVDRFNNVWRGESQNSVEISSVLSQEEYSEESLSVVSKEQLEIAEPSGSRGRASTDSAMESGGDHSRALSRRISDRPEANGRLMEDLEGGGELPRSPSLRVSDRIEPTNRLGDGLDWRSAHPRALPRRVSDTSFR
ncbi:uncharacterized protein LOC124142743 [Haliotis rufescens]|uniref:uncharacterized protein LOC124142743 n=1 Tax=Haliotis rufescens TaxID=6454 RepID=UPI001EB026D1|nr:uncharacterized protein LOC124142743 [Haliotis rufescens]